MGRGVRQQRCERQGAGGGSTAGAARLPAPTRPATRLRVVAVLRVGQRLAHVLGQGQWPAAKLRSGSGAWAASAGRGGRRLTAAGGQQRRRTAAASGGSRAPCQQGPADGRAPHGRRTRIAALRWRASGVSGSLSAGAASAGSWLWGPGVHSPERSTAMTCSTRPLASAVLLLAGALASLLPLPLWPGSPGARCSSSGDVAAAAAAGSGLPSPPASPRQPVASQGPAVRAHAAVTPLAPARRSIGGPAPWAPLLPGSDAQRSVQDWGRDGRGADWAVGVSAPRIAAGGRRLTRRARHRPRPPLPPSEHRPAATGRPPARALTCRARPPTPPPRPARPGPRPTPGPPPRGLGGARHARRPAPATGAHAAGRSVASGGGRRR